jgi:hypothetical protein
MVRFFVVEVNHLGSNPRFDVDVVYLRLIIISVVDDVLVDSETFFYRFCESQDQTDPVFRMCSYDNVCVCVFIVMSAHTCMSIYVYAV